MALDPVTHVIYLPTAEFEGGETEGKKAKLKPDTFKIVVLATTNWLVK
jgi:hypothetical protein